MSTPRYVYKIGTRPPKVHFVYDEVMQIEVFHWHGDNGPAKCEAVAKALNDLGHAID
jgi:hypothetical protein